MSNSANSTRNAGPFVIREMYFPKKGDICPPHKHNFDHLTYVQRGSLQFELLKELTPESVSEDGVVTEATYEVVFSLKKTAGTAHTWMLVKADALHRITALEDNSMGHCQYVNRDPTDGSVVEEYNGWEDAYR